MPASNDEEAINLLSFDGGGVRGVASLLILHEIMVQIKESCGLEKVPKPCEYFHMIGGTSTGGLIAIMLGRLRMSTEEALREYDQCSKKIFSFRNKKWTTLTEKFRATALKEVVEDLVRRRNMGEYLLDPSLDHDSKGQCFVCAMPAGKVGQPRRLRSFHSPGGGYAFEVKIWEAARATTAASTFFKPMPIKIGENTTEEYIDAAIGCNNPVNYLLQEAATQIGAGRRLGCLISIGTGTRVVQIGRASTGLRNVAHLKKFAKELIGTLKSTATDGEEPHRRIQAKLGSYQNAYFRFNVPDVADQVKLDEYLKVYILGAATAAYLSQPLVAAQILDAAIVLGRNLSDHGLTLGHADGIDKDQVILSTQEAQSLGDISRFFMARDDTLGKLDTCFPPRDTRGKPRREFLLYGLGGVGKTQIALKAADNLEDRHVTPSFKYIFHIDATAIPTVDQSYANICQRHCPGYSRTSAAALGTIEEMKDVALRWLEGLSDEWLMIYDNHPDKNRLAPILPRRNTGNIIYTSRSQGFLADLPVECVCEVKSFSEEDGVNLLLRIAGREDSRTDEKEMEALHGCVVEVGCLPLALESMGAYLRKEDCTALTYLQRFRERRNRSTLLSVPNSDGSLPARPGLYTALDLSYEAILGLQKREGRGLLGTAAQSALAALNLLCFYHNEEIPITMIGRSAEERQSWGSHAVSSLSRLAKKDDLPDTQTDATFLLACHYPQKTWDGTHFALGTQILQQFSLIKRSHQRNTVSMHVMVQTWAQDKMDGEIRRRQALFSRIVLIESIKPGWNRFDQTWMRCLAPHFSACMAHETEPLAPHDQYEALLDLKLGWYHYQQKHFSSAMDYFTRVVRVWKIHTGTCSGSTIQALLLLGSVYHDMGRIGDAEATYLEVLDRLSMRKNEILEAFEERLDREEEQRRREARRQRLTRLIPMEGSSGQKSSKEGKDQPPDTPDTHNSITNRDNTPQPMMRTLEHVLKEVDLATSQESQKDSLSMCELEEGSVYAEFSSLLFDSGRPKAGRECLRKAIQVAKIDSEHDLQIWTWEDELIRRSGGADLDYWLRRYEDINSLPPDLNAEFQGHDYAFVLPIGLADAFVAVGDMEEAYNIYKEVLERAPVLYGPSDRKTLYLMRSMAVCAVHRGLFEEAEELARKSVEAAKAAYGQWHYQTAMCLNTLAMVLVPQTLDLKPGSEYWNITQEAYGAVRVAFWEGHPMAKKLKKRLEEASYEPQTTGAVDEGLFQDVMAKILADGAPKSKQEYFERATVAYREARRERYQAQDKLNPEEKRRLARQRAAAKAELKARTSGTQETQPPAPTVGTADASCSRKNWKENERATTTMPPILEAGPNFLDDSAPMAEEASDCGSRPDVKGKGKASAEEVSQEVKNVEVKSSEMLPEELDQEKRNSLWTLETEVKVGERHTSGEPWIHVWESKPGNGGRKRVVTGAVLGDGEPRWRRIRSWDDFGDLIRLPNQEPDELIGD